MTNENNNCEPFEILISALIDDEISTHESQELETHLAVCQACHSHATGFRQVNELVDQHSSRDPFSGSSANTSTKVLRSTRKKSMAIWRLIPLAVAATLLVCFAIAAWPNPQPANAEQISPAQFVEPMKEIHYLNIQKQRDQDLMLRTLGMDLRSLKLELNELEAGSIERVKFAEQIDAMLEKVQAFE